MNIQPGARVSARTAFNEVVFMVAVSGPQAGLAFPVVWVCSQDEFDRATTAGDEPDAIAWPLDAVEVMEPA